MSDKQGFKFSFLKFTNPQHSIALSLYEFVSKAITSYGDLFISGVGNGCDWRVPTSVIFPQNF